MSADIGGSIRMPCYFCGIFGHKTTPGIVSTQGLWPEVNPRRQLLLSFGPVFILILKSRFQRKLKLVFKTNRQMTRYASDLKPMLKVMSGSNASKLELDKAFDLKQLKVYYMESDDNPFHTPVQSDIRNAIQKSVLHFAQKGCLVEEVYFDKYKYGFELWMRAMSDPTAPKFAQLVANLKGEINPTKELFKSLIGR